MIRSTQGFQKGRTNLLLNRIFNLIYLYRDNRSISLALQKAYCNEKIDF